MSFHDIIRVLLHTAPLVRLPERLALLGGVGIAFAVVGCHSASHAPDRSTVSAKLVERGGQTLPATTSCGQFTLPPGASLEDGLTEDEAISIALWNNAAFQELLADLGVSRGDLITAGLLPNPEFVYFWPVPNKPFKYAFEFPIEALWLRPIRMKTAAHEAERTADRLAQAGLDLIRDVRQAYADVQLARERLHVAEEAVKLRNRIVALAEKRLAAGEIAPQEAATARIDALQAQQDSTRIAFEIPVAEERLRNLLGLGATRDAIALDPSPPPGRGDFDAEELAQSALASRPDALATREAVAAAEARLNFAKLGWVRMLGVGDASSGRSAGHEFGPALRFTVPIFNRNQGNITRAEAELDRALRNQQTVANQIILDVQRANLQYQQAGAELELLRNRVRPEVEAAIQRSHRAYQQGNVNYLLVLESTRQLVDTYLREAQLHADLRRSFAELERSAGRKLSVPGLPVSPPLKLEDLPPVMPATAVIPVQYQEPKPIEPELIWRGAGRKP